MGRGEDNRTVDIDGSKPDLFTTLVKLARLCTTLRDMVGIAGCGYDTTQPKEKVICLAKSV